METSKILAKIDRVSDLLRDLREEITKAGKPTGPTLSVNQSAIYGLPGLAGDGLTKAEARRLAMAGGMTSSSFYTAFHTLAWGGHLVAADGGRWRVAQPESDAEA